MQKLEFSFCDVDWGSDEGKHDSKLMDYFVTFPEFYEILRGDKRYIIGRKGTGKTAVLEKIRLQAGTDPEMFFTDVSLKDFPFSDFKSLSDKRYRNKSKYVNAWKFLILIEYAKLVLSDNSNCTHPENRENIERLSQFISSNFPGKIGMVNTIDVLSSKKAKVTFPFLPGTSNGMSLEYGKDINKNITVRYDMAIEFLQETLCSLELCSKYYVLVDELDEGYKSDYTDVNIIILALLRACEDLSLYFSSKQRYFFNIVALRSDIFNSLEDNDLNKLDDYILELNWSTDMSGQMSLFSIVNQRITASVKKKFPELEVENYWNLVASTDEADAELWKHLCGMTFSRPRDIIKLMKYCSKSHDKKLTLSTLGNVEIKYSEWFYREFRDEVQSFLKCWKSVLNCLTEIAQGKASIHMLEQRLCNNPNVADWLKNEHHSAKEIIDLLFDYSVIGCVDDTGHWIFKYKDEEYFERLESYSAYCVHYGFCAKLRIKRTSYQDYFIKTI